jgi:ABC-type nitrate/sulfonate/bicarbonate transport system ATPase subunit
MSATAATDCAVSLRAVGKSYANGVVALDRLDLDVRPGEFVSLLGPSGCGKSTALRIIAGLSEPTSGEVIWPRPDATASEREIGFVFQEPTLMPWTTVAATCNCRSICNASMPRPRLRVSRPRWRGLGLRISLTSIRASCPAA